MQEFHHCIRRRRIRAIRGALAYGWHVQVAPALLAMLQDPDVLIRRTIIEVLGHVRTSETIAALVALKDDPSERIRETVKQALVQLASKEIPNPPLETTSTS